MTYSEHFGKRHISVMVFSITTKNHRKLMNRRKKSKRTETHLKKSLFSIKILNLFEKKCKTNANYLP